MQEQNIKNSQINPIQGLSKLWTRIHLVCILLIGFFFQQCSSDRDTVAEFGNKKITLPEFRQAYLNVLKQPNAYDSKELRENFLDELINRRLVAARASAEGLDEEERFLYTVRAYEDKCLRDAHYEHVIKPQITIDTKLVKQVYAYSTQQREVFHLFVTSKSQADSLYQLLQQGAEWNRLAKDIFENQILAESGGYLGWVYWDQMEYDLALAVFSQKLNSFSDPVKSSFGYHILLVTDFQYTPLISEDDFHLKKRATQKILEQKIGDRIANEYITKRMSEVKIQIYPQTLRRVGEHLKAVISRQPSAFDQAREMQLQPEEIQSLTNDLWEDRHEILVLIDSQEYTVGQFIFQLNFVPYQAVYQSLKTALDYAIRDFVLTREARQMNLQEKDQHVMLKTNLYREFLLHLDFRRKLARQARVTELQVYNYYDRNKDGIYRGMDYPQVRNDIETFLQQETSRISVVEFIQKARNEQTIRKNMALLHSYYDNIKQN